MSYFPQSSDDKRYFCESISNMSNCGLNSATASGLLFTPWLNDIFGPHLPAFGSRLGVGDLFLKFIFSLNRAWKWFNSKFDSKQNPKYLFQKIFFQLSKENSIELFIQKIWRKIIQEKKRPIYVFGDLLRPLFGSRTPEMNWNRSH